MKKRHVLGAALIGLTSLMPVMGSAATASFNFADLADTYAAGNGGHEGSWDQVTGGTLTDGAVTIVNAKGTYTGDPTGDNTHAFFDSSDASGSAGLGVCHSGWIGSVSGCSSNQPGANTSDDNITVGETLTLLFNTGVFFTDILFKNASHGLFNGSLVINGNVYSIAAGLLAAPGTLGHNATFTFAYDPASSPDSEVYISKIAVDTNPDNNPTPVPLPAGGLLLLGGLAGLGALKRKRKA